MAEQITDVDQVDSCLDQAHGPGPPERVRRDRQAGSPAGVARPDGPHVAGQQLGDPGPGQPGVVRPGEQRVRVGADAGMPIAVFEVAGDEMGGRVHHGHVPDLGTLPADDHRHRAAAADVRDVEVAEFLDAGGGVVGQGEQDGVPDSACAGRAGFGEQHLDLVPGQVPQILGRGLLLPDREDLGDLVEMVGLLDGGVAAKRLDHREALVAGSCRAAPLGLQPVQEQQDPGPVDVGQAQLLRRYALSVPEPGEQQFHRVPVGGHGLRRDCALPGQVAGEELRQPAPGKLRRRRGTRVHGSSPGAGMT